MQPTAVVGAYETETGSSDLLSSLSANPTAAAATTTTTTTTTTWQRSIDLNSDNVQEQYLVVLSGLIGSGKSTFARALCQHYPDWRRCNQDELGDRHAVVYAARTALLAGHNVVIDRTNIDAKQRRTWLELAQELCAPPSSDEAPEASSTLPRKIITISLTLTISTVVAQERLQVRVGHETIKTAQEALRILPHFLRTYQKATVEEGFHYALSYPAAKMSSDPSADEVKEILFDRLESETRADGVLPDRLPLRVGGAGRARGGAGGKGRGARGASAVCAPQHQHQHQYQALLPRQSPNAMQDHVAAPRIDTITDAQMQRPSSDAAALQPEPYLQPPQY